ncbi:Uncharacterized conserved protein YbjT, contains NAD(P)-binding and DUF2867 domains [Gracilibacillus orientalis]|uniref:Uncharacterized conserved protein YbjT, contains NAD(P)-binding and DUF2867 domains n=1 Tax=Gracilibacillus orientalis TaxID=334253 RepID=A0A1I4PEL8_9BACI|nr:NAD-dependent epimerase/dehydratase family protein [Gracilibacillus orientalis]SFM25966.1 Uncharacterized conserved protein YbjT, contains NAD(P)-binding and DUF2867 domains [Gracilibacillus orientalis]
MLLVTGITGHTGRYFLQELINHKYRGAIRCIVRESSDTSLIDNSGLNIEKVSGDLDDPNFINTVMNDVETIMHIYNIHHSPLIVKTAINKNVKRAILIHTTGIYSEFKYASEEYKRIEQKIKELTNDPKCLTKVTILRPSMIYGDLCDRNMSKFIKMIDKLRVMLVINGGNSLIQPVNARDLGAAFYTVLTTSHETDGKAYDLTGEKPIKIVDALKLISNEFNKKTVFISVPIDVGVLMAKIFKIVSFGKVDYIEKVQRMGEDRSYSHKSATNDFGYKPMSFKNGIKIEVAEYVEAKQKNE